MLSKEKLGFLVNPIAGMGGPVGLKGTDGLAEEAMRRGGRPVSPERARTALTILFSHRDIPHVLSVDGEMGGRYLRELEVPYRSVASFSMPTDSSHTREAVRRFCREEADLILFCGGDGTARDVASEAGDTPILGIPAGVKMHSGIFAISPQAAADLVRGFMEGRFSLRETEIVDVDEDSYRQGELRTRLYATAMTPYAPALVQQRKQTYSIPEEDSFKDEIADFAREFMRDGSYYIVGAGTTTSAIARAIGLKKTLLGVDVFKDDAVVLSDASEEKLLKLLDMNTTSVGVRIIVSPIGAQGFILGRGSQQISPTVLKRVGPENLIIVATPHKLGELSHLLVDTGDEQLDRSISGPKQVIVGYRLARLMEIKAASSLWSDSVKGQRP